MTDPVCLSAIVPNYNHGAVIGEAIAALARQSPAPDEIIVVDDGSTDDSRAILEALRAHYPALRVIALAENGGAIAALNRGLAEARGEFVYFAAADDVTLPGLFAATRTQLARHPDAAFASCEAIVVDERGRFAMRPPVRPSYAAAFFSPADVARLLRRIDNWILTGTALARRDALIEAGGFDAGLGAFADSFVFRLLSLRHGCCFIPQPGVIWRQNDSGQSRSQAADPSASFAALDAALARMKQEPAFPAWYPAVFARRWRFAIGRIAAVSDPMNAAMLSRLGRGAVGRAALRIALRTGGRAGRLGALALLTMQERPTALTGLARTWLSRRNLEVTRLIVGHDSPAP